MIRRISGVRIAAVAVVAAALGACGDAATDGVSSSERGRTALHECLAKGEAYFREIGSWPVLSDGRDAVEVVADRCSRTTGAFDGLD